MKRIALLFASLIFSISCFAQVPEKEQVAITATVEKMLAALQSGKDDVAFSLHVPEIRDQFGTAEGFANYVRENVAVLSDHETAVVVDIQVHQATVIAVTAIDYDGSIWLVMFSMEISEGGVWLISGCGIQRTASKGV